LRTEGHIGVEQGQDADGEDALDQRDPERQLSGPFVGRSHLEEHLADNGGRGNDEQRGKENPGRALIAEEQSEQAGKMVGDCEGTQHPEDHSHPEPSKLAQAQSQPDREHEKDQSDLRQHLDPR
jgi:hypothetical protein